MCVVFTDVKKRNDARTILNHTEGTEQGQVTRGQGADISGPLCLSWDRDLGPVIQSPIKLILG